MAFVGVDVVSHLQPFGPHGLNHLIRFTDVDAGVVGPLAYEQGNTDVLSVKEGGDPLVQSFVILYIADSQNHLLLHGCPVGRNGLKQGRDVRGSDEVDAARVERGGEGQARQCGVPTVGAAEYADFLGVGDSLG